MSATTDGNGRIPVEIPLVVVGCDFRTAPSSLRGALVTTPEERMELCGAIRRMDPGAGFMALETCNRNEWIVTTEEPGWIGELLCAQMLSRWAGSGADEGDAFRVNVFVGREAAFHLFRTVAGMESLASGEAEIAGQFQHSLQAAMAEKTTSRILNGIGRFAGGMAKTAFRLGYRSTRTRGIHVLVGQYLAEHFGEGRGDRRALVIGMGEIGRKIADFVEGNADFSVVRMNRTVLERHAGTWAPLAELATIVESADALVLATGAAAPVLDASMLSRLPSDRRLLILDVGIPRQAHADVETLPQVMYRSVDDLASLASAASSQQDEGLTAEVAQQVERFRRFCLERHMVSLLKRVQEKRTELTRETIGRVVDGRLADLLDEGQRIRVVQAMRELVLDYSDEVFESLHSALVEFWSNE